MTDTNLGPLHRLSHLSLISSLQDRHYHIHFMVQKTEAQRGQVFVKGHTASTEQSRGSHHVLWPPWTLFFSLLPSYTAWLPAHRVQNSGIKKE